LAIGYVVPDMTRLWTAAVLLLTISAGCDGGTGKQQASATPGGSGVKGIATVDAGCPVLEDASACPRVPLHARIVAVWAGTTKRAATVETNLDGAFQMTLMPGAYQLEGETLTGAPYPAATPVLVNVRENEFAQVMVVFDSGVRAPGGN